MTDEICGIYLITCQPPGKLPLYYVGQSRDIRTRFRKHKQGLKNGKHSNKRLVNNWMKYGESSFKFEPVELCSTEELDDCEAWWLSEMVGHPRVFNICRDPSSPNRGRKFSREYKEKMSSLFVGDKNPFFGKKHTEEARTKISKAATGRKISDAHKDAVREASKRRICSKETREKLSKARKGHKHSDETKAKLSARRLSMPSPGEYKEGIDHPFSKPVIATNMETGEESRYESARIAEGDGFYHALISKCCRGLQKYHKGHTWRFADEVMQ